MNPLKPRYRRARNVKFEISVVLFKHTAPLIMKKRTNLDENTADIHFIQENIALDVIGEL